MRIWIISFLFAVPAGAEVLTLKTSEGTERLYPVPGAFVDFREPVAQGPAGVQVQYARGEARSATLPPGVSPVYSDSPKGGNRRALAPGVIVRFKERLSQGQLAERLGRTVKSAKPLGGKAPAAAWWVETPAGLESLRTAQSLQTRRGIVSVEPNWWLEVAPR